MIIVADIGNSYLKMACWDGHELSARQRVRHRDLLDADWQASIGGYVKAPCECVYVASVANESVEQTFEAWLFSHGHDRPVYLQSTRQAGGVRNAYREPRKLGVDRWCAMIAARAQHAAGPIAVVDIGTAMTVDWVDGSGQHRGGLIMPGPSLQSESLLAGTSHVRGASHAAAGFFSDNTADAVNAGTCHACASLIDCAVERIVAEEGKAPRVFLTGGEAGRVAPLLSTKAEVQKDLVLRGVACLADETRR